MRTKISRLEEGEGDGDSFLDTAEEGGGNNQTTLEEDMFWEEDRQGRAAWVAEARRYKLPICTRTLRLACPAKECIEKNVDMVPVYIECKSRQGGTYVSMMYCCNYCNAMTDSREEAQKNNIFAGHNVSKFVQNYIRRARDCGVNDISSIPLPESAPANIPNQASNKLPNVDIIQEMKTKLDEIHQIIVQGMEKKKKKKKGGEPPEFVCGTCEDEFEKIELGEEEEEEEEEISCSQPQSKEEVVE